MYFHVQELINEIVPDEPDPAAANALQEGLGGQFGEMRTMMQYLFQSFNFRGPATQYKDLIHAVAVEEISHVELIATTIARLLDGAPGYVPNGDGGVPGAGGGTPLNAALGMGRMQNIHHFLVGAQGAMPVDAVGNPWMGSYVYNSGNLVLDLLYNLMLESTGRLQKCRIYEMSANKTLRATVAYLIVRDEVHEKVYAKALESLGVDWGKTLPIPNFDASKFPEVQALYDRGIGDVQWTFRLDGSRAGEVFHGNSPFNDGTTVRTADRPEQGFAMPQAPERPEEFAPGLTPELMELARAAAAMATKGTTFSGPGVSGAAGTAKVLGKVRTDGTEIPLKGGDHIEVSRGDERTTTMRPKKK
ncbi:MAG TPA: manganese catalase family protein [Chloroflexota bacterium]|jgi:Mn-containing catalase